LPVVAQCREQSSHVLQDSVPCQHLAWWGPRWAHSLTAPTLRVKQHHSVRWNHSLGSPQQQPPTAIHGVNVVRSAVVAVGGRHGRVAGVACRALALELAAVCAAEASWAGGRHCEGPDMDKGHRDWIGYVAARPAGTTEPGCKAARDGGPSPPGRAAGINPRPVPADTSAPLASWRAPASHCSCHTTPATHRTSSGLDSTPAWGGLRISKQVRHAAAASSGPI
jgi:hypothetical protein